MALLTPLLFISSSGGHLPLLLDQWTRGAECFKSYNEQQECFGASDCVKRDCPFCVQFQSGGGNDFGTVMLYQWVAEDDPGCWDVDLQGRSTWVIVTAITNVNKHDPIQDVSGKSCDNLLDSVFSSVHGKENDVLLMSSLFDDPAMLPPSGASILGYIWVRGDVSFIIVVASLIHFLLSCNTVLMVLFGINLSKARFLFEEKLDHTGETGTSITKGQGGPYCKDALLSVVVKRDKRV